MARPTDQRRAFLGIGWKFPLQVTPSDVFRKLRDTNNLKGKCGVCEFRELCGGSRSRAWSVTGDAFDLGLNHLG